MDNEPSSYTVTSFTKTLIVIACGLTETLKDRFSSVEFCQLKPSTLVRGSEVRIFHFTCVCVQYRNNNN